VTKYLEDRYEKKDIGKPGRRDKIKEFGTSKRQGARSRDKMVFRVGIKKFVQWYMGAQ